jgi:hypothetical protein
VDAYDRVIQSIGEQCDRAAKASQDAWARNDPVAAKAADREYCLVVRLYHAHVLRKSIDAGLVVHRDEDRELLRLIEN